MADNEKSGWTGSWTTTASVMDGIVLDGQTIRMIAHTSIGGRKLRVRLSNAYG
ncbi:MAG: SGNH/GDSL hydrolase family protein, partial [Rhodospirillales bacterium]|nr:SGNH/GDSL hydrolase family protein [Rhodospirillales bacterium]